MHRVLILADTHGFLDPRIAELAKQCRWVVHGGDIGAATVLGQLEQGGAQVLAVRGNNDVTHKWPEPGRDRLDALPHIQTVDLPGGELVIEHGDRINPAARRHAMLREKYPHARAVVYGHSHCQVCDQSASPWILNPGAAGRSRTYGGGPACLLLRVTEDTWQIETRRFKPLGKSANVVAG